MNVATLESGPLLHASNPKGTKHGQSPTSDALLIVRHL